MRKTTSKTGGKTTSAKTGARKSMSAKAVQKTKLVAARFCPQQCLTCLKKMKLKNSCAFESGHKGEHRCKDFNHPY